MRVKHVNTAFNGTFLDFRTEKNNHTNNVHFFIFLLMIYFLQTHFSYLNQLINKFLNVSISFGDKFQWKLVFYNYHCRMVICNHTTMI